MEEEQGKAMPGEISENKNLKMIEIIYLFVLGREFKMCEQKIQRKQNIRNDWCHYSKEKSKMIAVVPGLLSV